MKYWWNQGVHEKCLSTYCFLVRDTIPMKVRNLTQSRWHINIHNMLQRIPLRKYARVEGVTLPPSEDLCPSGGSNSPAAGAQNLTQFGEKGKNGSET